MMKAADISVPGGWGKEGLCSAGVARASYLPWERTSIGRFP